MNEAVSDLPLISVRQKTDKRVTMWFVSCEEHGGLGVSSDKTGASKMALAHAEKIHGRRARIKVPT